ncbi:MAG: hypothetical protein EAZ44_06065 [Cytophagia bacterium]|nr:MAG: hypothetical protein EAZ44_06065 [Cytophagia bacterium]TAG42754.1 MAG: hypothetical protein EAZ31_05465 [Cytophagia bacterium]
MIVFIITRSQSQDKKVIDSLMRVYNTTKYDTTRIMGLINIAEEYRNNRRSDTCTPLAEKAFVMSEKIGFNKGKGWSLFIVAKEKINDKNHST